jgi:hypothetical protein
MMLGSPALASLIKTSQSTALAILKRIAIVINNSMNDESRAINSANFAALICRRSLLTPEEKHPLAEEIKMQAQAESDAAASAEWQRQQEAVLTQVSELGEAAVRVYELLSSDPICFDNLLETSDLTIGKVSSALTMLELEGVITALPGNYYVRGKASPTFKDGLKLPAATDSLPLNVLNEVESIHQFVRIRSDGTSRKYLQLCLAIFWCCRDRMHWGFRTLLQACAQSLPITYKDVLLFVSPARLQLAASAP